MIWPLELQCNTTLCGMKYELAENQNEVSFSVETPLGFKLNCPNLANQLLEPFQDLGVVPEFFLHLHGNRGTFF